MRRSERDSNEKEKEKEKEKERTENVDGASDRTKTLFIYTTLFTVMWLMTVDLNLTTIFLNFLFLNISGFFNFCTTSLGFYYLNYFVPFQTFINRLHFWLSHFTQIIGTNSRFWPAWKIFRNIFLLFFWSFKRIIWQSFGL